MNVPVRAVVQISECFIKLSLWWCSPEATINSERWTENKRKCWTSEQNSSRLFSSFQSGSSDYSQMWLKV